MTGTKGIDTAPAGGGVGLGVGVGLGGGVPLGVPFGVGVGPVTTWAVGLGVTVTTACEPLGAREGAGGPDAPGATVGGVDEPHAAKTRPTTAQMTSRVETNRFMAGDLTDCDAAE